MKRTLAFFLLVFGFSTLYQFTTGCKCGSAIQATFSPSDNT